MLPCAARRHPSPTHACMKLHPLPPPLSCTSGRPARYAYVATMEPSPRGVPQFIGITKMDLQASAVYFFCAAAGTEAVF